jgi:hypothetical protein
VGQDQDAAAAAMVVKWGNMGQQLVRAPDEPEGAARAECLHQEVEWPAHMG